MDHIKNFTASVQPFGQKISERFGTLNQQARERLGHADDLTELPEEYKQLEQRVDAMKHVHQTMMRTIKTYENEAYDYPHHLQESVTHGAQSLSHTLSSWAAQATKHTSLPQVHATSAPPSYSRTLSHAISRSATESAIELGKGPQQVPASMGGEMVATPESKLAELLQRFAVAEDVVGSARLKQDRTIVDHFILVWNSFGNQINLAVKARQQVRDARLHLDGWRGHLKSAEQSNTATAKLDQYRNEVEQAEDKLVSATEEAISLMKTVLDNPEPIKALVSLVQAQLEYHREAANTLETVEMQMKEIASKVEDDFRSSRE